MLLSHFLTYKNVSVHFGNGSPSRLHLWQLKLAIWKMSLLYIISYLNTCNWKFSPWQKCGLLLNKASSMWALMGRYHHQENGKELDLQAGVDWVLLCQGLSSEYFLAKSWHHWRSLGGQYQQRWSCSLHPPGQREQLRSALYSWKTGFLKSFKSNTLKIALANEELLRTIPIKWCFKFAEL